MPLSNLELSTAIRFSFTTEVTDWADIEQGENSLASTLAEIDLDVWDQAFATIYNLDAAETATIDLRSFTNLANESVVMTAALGIVIRVTHEDAADTDGELTIGTGAANGFEAWFLPNMVIDCPTAGSTRTVVMCGDITDEGVTVDATHKTIDLENTGTDTILVTVVVIGSTV